MNMIEDYFTLKIDIDTWHVACASSPEFKQSVWVAADRDGLVMPAGRGYFELVSFGGEFTHDYIEAFLAANEQLAEAA